MKKSGVSKIKTSDKSVSESPVCNTTVSSNNDGLDLSSNNDSLDLSSNNDKPVSESDKWHTKDTASYYIPSEFTFQSTIAICNFYDTLVHPYRAKSKK